MLLTALTFSAGVFNGFVYDDHRLIERNPLIQDLAKIPFAFGVDLAGGTGWQIYRPFVAIGFMLDHAIWSLDPRGYHLSNVLWHLLAVAGLFWAVRELVQVFCAGNGGNDLDERRARMRRWLPAATAVLFAIHPLNSESVFWIARRADVMAAAFGFCAIAAWGRWLRFHRRRWMVAGCFSVAAAILSKEIGIVLPPVLTLVTVVSVWSGSAEGRRPHGRRAVLTSFLPWVWIPLTVALRWHLFGTVTGQPSAFVQNWLIGMDAHERVVAIIGLLGHYSRLLAFPVGLSADYSFRSLVPHEDTLLLIVGAAAIGVRIALLVWGLRHRRAPLVVIGVMLEAATYLPVSNAFATIGTATAERLYYVPSAAWWLALSAFGLHVLPVLSRSALRIAGALLLGVALLGSVATHLRAKDWEDDLTLFRDVVGRFPENVVARTYLGIAWSARGELDDAEREYSAALAIYPEYHIARVNLAGVYLRLGENGEAARHARRVIEREPDSGPPHLTLGVALMRMGDWDEAERELRLATRDRVTAADARAALVELARLRTSEGGAGPGRTAAGG